MAFWGGGIPKGYYSQSQEWQDPRMRNLKEDERYEKED